MTNNYVLAVFLQAKFLVVTLDGNSILLFLGVQCPKRGTIKNGGVSCTDSVFVGSLCTSVLYPTLT